MRTSVTFMSRAMFLRSLPKLDGGGCAALISISDNRRELQDMKALMGDHCISPWIAIQFQDVDKEDGTGITMQQAHEISQFVQDNQGCDFFVHCFAGVSRSAAVAKFIDEYYDIKEPVLRNYTIYNKLVFGKLQATVNRMSLEEYYRQLENERNL